MKTKINPSWVRVPVTDFRNNISEVCDVLDEMEVGCVLTRHDRDAFLLQPIGQIDAVLSPTQKELVEKRIEEIFSKRRKK